MSNRNTTPTTYSPGSDTSLAPRMFVLAGLVVLGPLLVLGDTLLAIRRGYAMSRMTQGLVASMALVCLLITLAFVLPQGRRVWKRFSAKLAAACVAVVCSLVVAELALGFLFKPVPFHLRTAGLQSEFQPLPKHLPGVSGASQFRVNSLGIRGEELPARSEAYRILCVGGSTTECTYLDDQETWPDLLMQRLNAEPHQKKVWVGNAGMAGYDSVHHYQLVQNDDFVGQFDCIVMLVGFNDLARLLRHAPPGGQTPYPYWRKTRLASIAYNLLLGGVYHDKTGAVYENWREERRRAGKTATVADLSAGLSAYQDTLHAIIAVSKSHNCRLVFATQPVLWKEGLTSEQEALLWMGDLADGRYLEPAAARHAMDAYNAVLCTTARDENVELVELDSLSGHADIFYDDCHFTEQGARAVANLLAARLSRDVSQPRPRQAEFLSSKEGQHAPNQ